jgi:hypothetical protein
MRLKIFDNFKIIERLSSVMSASDLEVGDRIKVTYYHQTVEGEIVDHFGDGVFIMLDHPLRYKKTRNDNVANPMAYGSIFSSTTSFELYDGEEAIPGLTFENIEKL